MKRTHAQIINIEDSGDEANDGVCRLLDDTPAELRMTICTFLPIPAISRLAHTCTYLANELVFAQTGPLYLPGRWKLKVNEPTWAAFHRFMRDRHSLGVFAGLYGAQMHLRLDVIVGYKSPPCVFKVFVNKDAPGGIKFEYGPSGYCSLPPPEEVLKLKAEAREKHAAKLAKDRQNRKVPPELRAERTRLNGTLSTTKSGLLTATRWYRETFARWGSGIGRYDVGQALAQAKKIQELCEAYLEADTGLKAVSDKIANLHQ